MEQGTVKTVTDKGFGFITREGSDKDIFYHENSLPEDLAARKLKEGDVVTYDVEETEKGLNATNIKLLES